MDRSREAAWTENCSCILCIYAIHGKNAAGVESCIELDAGCHWLYENSKNPFRERREQIAKWQGYSELDIEEEAELLKRATQFNQHGIKRLDALHIAAAIRAKADYFLTTDDGLLRKSILIEGTRITDPIGFVKEVQT